MDTYKSKTKVNQADRLSSAVGVVLAGQMPISMAVVTYAKPDEMNLFVTTIRKHCSNVFC